MLAQQLRGSSSLLDSLNALRNWRVLLMLALVFMATAVVWSAGGSVLASAGRRSAPMFLGAIPAVLLLLWGTNSAGILMMDQAAGRPGRTVGQAMRASLGATQQLVLVLLALALFYMLGLLALTVLLLICSVPVVGPWLYILVFPVGAAASGLALFILPTLVAPLCGAAIWCGLDASTALAQLWAAMRHRLALVLSWTLLLSCIAAAVGLVLSAVLFAGFSVTGSLSASMLGVPQDPWSGVAGMPSLTIPGGTSSGAAAYLQAGTLGSLLLWAAACAVPGLVAMSGACIIYRRALFGMSTAQEEQALSQTLASAVKRAPDLRGPFGPKASGTVAVPVAGATTDAGAAPEIWQRPMPPAFPASSSTVGLVPATQQLDSESAQVRLMMHAMSDRRDVPAPSTAYRLSHSGAALPEQAQQSSSAHATWLHQNARAIDVAPGLSTRHHCQQQHQLPQQFAWSRPQVSDFVATNPGCAVSAALDLDLEAPYAEVSSSIYPTSSATNTLVHPATMKIKSCSFCGEDAGIDDIFCVYCGKPLLK